MLSLIGNQYGDDSVQAMGAVLQCRFKMDKLALWTSVASDQAACLRIGAAFRDAAGLSGKIGYQAHDTVASGAASFEYEISD